MCIPMGVCWGVEGMCTLGVLRDMCVLGCWRGCVCWGVEGDVWTCVLMGMCVLGC